MSVFIAVAVLAPVFLAAQPAGATHFRAESLTWTVTTGHTAQFSSSIGLRRSYFSPLPNVGTTLPAGVVTMHFGDNATANPTYTVTQVDQANDWILATSTFNHTYAGQGPYTAYLDSCCRLSRPSHINNPDGTIRVETLVNFTAPQSPVSAMAPIVDCPKNATCRFIVPATAPSGETLHFRLSTSMEAGGTGGFVQPADSSGPATIDPTTGLYVWNTTGAILAPAGTATYYSTQVTVEGWANGVPVTKTAVDFFIRLSDSASPDQPPAFNDPTPADGTTITTVVGSPVSFNVSADDPDTGDTVELEMIGKPADATFTTTDGNPASGSFSWTPTGTGSTILNLTAEDQLGLGATARSVTIIVNKATPVINWSNPDAIVYGTPLGPTQLNATATHPTSGNAISGSFVYTLADGTTPADGAVLNAGNGQVLNTTFTPDDTSNYNSASSQVQIDVNKAPAQVTLDPNSLTQTYDGSIKTVGVSTQPANLAVDLSFTQAGNPATPQNAGSYQVTATVNDPNYTGSATGTLTINKADQTINFGPLSDREIGSASFTVSATASTQLPVSFTASPASVCTISGNTVTLVGGGTCTITASQVGDENYNAAPNVVQSFNVSYDVQTQYDTAKANKSGSTIPITVQLNDANGLNLSSASITLHAVRVQAQDGSIYPVQSPGNSQPGDNFTYANGSYQFNLKTTGLTSGTYMLEFTISGDAVTHSVPFVIK